MKLRFAKMSGAGNDFVLVEGPLSPGKASSLARRLCGRRDGIMADGLLVVSKRGPRLDYFNADGSAAFCGNGTRCAAWWAHRRGWTGGRRAFALTTSEGRLQVRVAGLGRAAVRMMSRAARLGLRLKAAGRAHVVHAINTGVPHAVVFVNNLERVDVPRLGRALRNHGTFRPAGANVDFVQAAGKHLLVRTYERGVEAETLACGTGAVASALIAALLGRARPPIRVRTRGGDELKVSFRPAAAGAEDIWLEGPARILFTGEIDL